VALASDCAHTAGRPSRARTAALSWFFGWSVADLDQSDDAKLGGVQDQLFKWVETLETQGTVAFCAKVWSDSGVAARVLATGDGTVTTPTSTTSQDCCR